MRRGEPAVTLGRAEWSWLPQIPHLLCTDLNELLLIYFKREGTKGFSLGRGTAKLLTRLGIERWVGRDAIYRVGTPIKTGGTLSQMCL